MSNDKVRPATVSNDAQVGRLTCVAEDATGEVHWVPVGNSKPGDKGMIEYRTGASYGLWFWVPNKEKQA